MTQKTFYADEIEDEIIDNLSKKWKINKQETIKRMIREFEKNKKIDFSLEVGSKK